MATTTSEQNGTIQAGGLAPTRKWFTALITGVGAILVTGVSTGTWGRELAAAAIGLVVQLSIAYLTPNHDTMGGAPPEGTFRKVLRMK